MRLEIRHWQLLKVISESVTMRKAADVLGITQPALSHRLAEAERRLGGALFEREGRRLRLTPAGRAMTQTALQSLPVLKRAEDEFMRLETEAAHLVRVGIAAYSCYHWLPEFLKAKQRKDSKIQIELVAAATQNPIQSLLESEADLVIAPEHLVRPGITAIPLFSDELVLVVPADHRLASKEFIVAEDLFDEEYLTYSRTQQPGFEYERFIRPSGVQPKFVKVVEMTDAIIELVATGFGIAILARWALEPALKTGRVVALRVGSDGLDINWAALIRESEPQLSPTRSLADLLSAWYQ
ncbi:MAG: LysR family transcriptional regulator for metE and metH [Parasphingorhabdus sp.]|jgi:LysR family transcriptional regulator for metE and metH